MNWENLVAMGKEKLLDSMNLEERRSTGGKFFSTLGIFAAGAVVGGAVALLLAPQTGEDFRKEIGERFTKLTGIGGDKEEGASATGGGNSRMGGATGGGRTGTATSRPATT